MPASMYIYIVYIREILQRREKFRNIHAKTSVISDLSNTDG